jgi:murein DD-endopeptidase MepM/ murein hydrolase activator NlpD
MIFKDKIKNILQKPLFPWLTKEHRLVVINDNNFKEIKSWQLTRKNVIIFSSMTFLSIVLFTMLLLKYTPLGKLVAAPTRLANKELRKEMETIYVSLDSLNKEVKSNAFYIESLRKISSEDFEYEKDLRLDSTEKGTNISKTFADVPDKSKETNKLLKNVQKEKEINSLVQSLFTEMGVKIDKSSFIAPVRGIVTDTFAPARSHFGTDIASTKGSVIQATRNGTVIMSTWSADTGHMIGIQHDNNLISWYKHNSARLKNLGDRVQAGEAIAIIGNSGEMSSGPHLHFELWYNGQPVNPQNYIQF